VLPFVWPAMQFKVSRQLGELGLRLQRAVREAHVSVGMLREALAVAATQAALPSTGAVLQAVAGSSGAELSTAVLLGQQVEIASVHRSLACDFSAAP
jgi:hypothetical protein